MTLKEICETMAKNRRGVNFVGKDTKNKRPVHPIYAGMEDVVIYLVEINGHRTWAADFGKIAFRWDYVISLLKKQNAPTPVDIERILIPLMVFDKGAMHLTMYWTADSNIFNQAISGNINPFVVPSLPDNVYNAMDVVNGAYVSKVITHKTALNTGRTNHFWRSGRITEKFMDDIVDHIHETGYRQMFNEIVFNEKGRADLFFWITKRAGVLIDYDVTQTRQDEITQLMLNSTVLGSETCTKVWDFLYNAAKTALPEGKIGDVSDGYHTFNELYHHRAVLFAALCNLYPDYAWKSKQHDDPNFPMYDGMFICGINTPDGQATYHYDIDPYWDMFDVPELPRAPKFDGHTPAMAIERIRSLNTSYAHPTCTIKFRNAFTDECDKFLLACWKKNSAEYDCHTEFYIDGTESNGNDTFIVPFRFPGATRGHVTINGTSGRVIEVKFYATAYEDGGIACYMDTINSLIVEWEGGLMPKLAEYCRMRKHGWVEITTDGCKAR